MKLPKTADFVNLSSISAATGFFCFAVGVILGYIYFYSLWKTVEYFCNHDKRKIILFWSFLIRTALLLSCFVLVADRNFIRLAICFAGFYLTRYVFIGHEALKKQNSCVSCETDDSKEEEKTDG